MATNMLDAAAALAQRLILQAMTLQATAKHTFDALRTRSLPKPWLRLSSDMVASMPARIL